MDPPKGGAQKTGTGSSSTGALDAGWGVSVSGGADLPRQATPLKQASKKKADGDKRPAGTPLRCPNVLTPVSLHSFIRSVPFCFLYKLSCRHAYT